LENLNIEDNIFSSSLDQLDKIEKEEDSPELDNALAPLDNNI